MSGERRTEILESMLVLLEEIKEELEAINVSLAEGGGD